MFKVFPPFFKLEKRFIVIAGAFKHALQRTNYARLEVVGIFFDVSLNLEEKLIYNNKSHIHLLENKIFFDQPKA